MQLAAMPPTTEDINAMHPEDPCMISLSISDLDNSCETYFYCACSTPSMRSAIPEASPVFRRALGTMENKTDHSPYSSESEYDIDDFEKQIRNTTSSPKRNTSISSSSSSSSSTSSSSSSTPSSSPAASPQRSRSSAKPIAISSPSPRKATPTRNRSTKYLSVPSSSLPTNLSTPLKGADLSDSGAHNTLAGVAMRKGCTRKAASFGGYDTIKVDSHRFEKKVSWADERGSKHQLIHVRLIRPRLATGTSDGTSSTPGQSILKTLEN